MIFTTIKEYSIQDLNIKIQVVDFCEGSSWFNDLYTPSKHNDLYTKQGQEAYESLSKELEHYINANDSVRMSALLGVLKVTVSKAGVELVKNYGTSFDFSFIYHDSYGLRMLAEYGDDFVIEAIKEAKNTIQLLTA